MRNTMNTKERHELENERREDAMHTPENIENSMIAGGRKRHDRSTRKINRLWLWLGVLVLILILLYWIFFIAIDFGPNQ